MFTGIIESVGTITDITNKGSNRTFRIESLISNELKIDQSVSHNGVCLTVTAVHDNQHEVTAIAETLEKTNLGNWQPGTRVNLERCVPLNGRLDGHLVQGHVDGTGRCLWIEDKKGSYELRFQIDPSFAPLIIEKGSISLNGISLTIFNVSRDAFTVAIIPYTWDHTNIGQLREGDPVNLEFDLVGKYLQRRASLSASGS
jgi:riboflavin synthase